MPTHDTSIRGCGWPGTVQKPGSNSMKYCIENTDPLKARISKRLQDVTITAHSAGGFSIRWAQHQCKCGCSYKHYVISPEVVKYNCITKKTKKNTEPSPWDQRQVEIGTSKQPCQCPCNKQILTCLSSSALWQSSMPVVLSIVHHQILMVILIIQSKLKTFPLHTCWFGLSKSNISVCEYANHQLGLFARPSFCIGLDYSLNCSRPVIIS